MADARQKLAYIINTASYERVAFALGTAAAAAALGREVHVLFGHGAVVRLKKGAVDEIGEETAAWLREDIVTAVQKGRITRVSETLGMLRKLGGKVYACPAAMAVHNLVKEQLIDDMDGVHGGVQFLNEDAIDSSSIVYV